MKRSDPLDSNIGPITKENEQDFLPIVRFKVLFVLESMSTSHELDWE